MKFNVLTYRDYSRATINVATVNLLTEQFGDLKFEAYLVRSFHVAKEGIKEAEKFLRRHKIHYTKRSD